MGRKVIDMTGQVIGKWTVIERSNKKTSNNNVYWTCQCKCGAIQEICGTDLRKGKTLQCKHCAGGTTIKNLPITRHYKQNNDEIGKTYGQLTVLEKVEQTPGGSIWRCKCICGNEVDVRINNLHSGKTQSCGCIKSRGENIINKILQENNIVYKREYSFEDLLGVNQGKLRFDFAIFSKDNQLIELIEFQGKQHFEETSLWNNDNKIHDEYKRKYCKEHNIELLEIPYYDIDKITLEYLNIPKEAK